MKMADKWTLFGKWLVIITMLAGFTGCAGRHPVTTMAVNVVGSRLPILISKIQDSGSGQLVREGLAANVLLVTGLTELSPKNQTLLTQCAYLYAAQGMFVEEEDPVYAQQLYSIGKEYGMRALMTDRSFRKGIERGEKISELVDELDEDHLEAVFWTGMNTGLLVLQRMDDPAALMELSDVSALIQRSIEIDENFLFGAGKAFMGAYYAMIPEFLGLGGGPDSSKAMFAEARKISGGKFLLVDVFECRFLHTLTGAEKQFEQTLEDVLSTDSSVLKDGQLLNELAKRKARYFLDHKKTFFY